MYLQMGRCDAMDDKSQFTAPPPKKVKAFALESWTSADALILPSSCTDFGSRGNFNLVKRSSCLDA